MYIELSDVHKKLFECLTIPNELSFGIVEGDATVPVPGLMQRASLEVVEISAE